MERQSVKVRSSQTKLTMRGIAARALLGGISNDSPGCSDRRPTGLEKKVNAFWSHKTTKVIVFIVSIGLVVAGQYLLGQSEPIESLVPTSQRINDQFRIDVDNLENVLAGVPLLLLGGILFAISVREIIFCGDKLEADFTDENPTLRRNSKWINCLIMGGGSFALLLISLFLSLCKVFLCAFMPGFKL